MGVGGATHLSISSPSPPSLPFTCSRQIQIAVDRSRQLVALRALLQRLSAATLGLRRAGLNPQLEGQVHAWCLALSVSIDKLMNIKEFRTPQV
jgi:hypothetical protein